MQKTCFSNWCIKCWQCTLFVSDMNFYLFSLTITCLLFLDFWSVLNSKPQRSPERLFVTMSWVGCLLKDSELFILLAEKSQNPNPSQNFCYSHSLNFHLFGSTESVSKQPTYLIIQLNSSLRHIIVTNRRSRTSSLLE